MRPQIGVITNPNSKKNRKRPGRREQLARAVGKHGVVRETANIDAIPAVVEELLEAGCSYWVSDGGDGALHWMVNALDTELRRREAAGRPLPWPAIVPTNGGTIDFVAKKVGIRGHAEEILAELAALLDRDERPSLVAVDSLRVEGPLAGPASNGKRPVFNRIGFASALAGVAQRFFAKYYEDALPGPLTIVRVLAKAFGGYFASLTPARRAVPEWLVTYGEEVFRPAHAQVVIDGKALPYEEFVTVQVGAIDINLGDVVRTFRLADELGILHMQAIDFSPAEVIANIPTIVLGSVVKGKRTFDGPAHNVRIVPRGGSLDPVIDGECFFGLSEASISVGPTMRIPAVCTK